MTPAPLLMLTLLPVWHTTRVTFRKEHRITFHGNAHPYDINQHLLEKYTGAGIGYQADHHLPQKVFTA